MTPEESLAGICWSIVQDFLLDRISHDHHTRAAASPQFYEREPIRFAGDTTRFREKRYAIVDAVDALYEHLQAMLLGEEPDDADAADYRMWCAGVMKSGWGLQKDHRGESGLRRFPAHKQIAKLARERGYTMQLIPETPRQRAQRRKRHTSATMRRMLGDPEHKR